MTSSGSVNVIIAIIADVFLELFILPAIIGHGKIYPRLPWKDPAPHKSSPFNETYLDSATNYFADWLPSAISWARWCDHKEFFGNIMDYSNTEEGIAEALEFLRNEMIPNIPMLKEYLKENNDDSGEGFIRCYHQSAKLARREITMAAILLAIKREKMPAQFFNRFTFIAFTEYRDPVTVGGIPTQYNFEVGHKTRNVRFEFQTYRWFMDYVQKNWDVGDWYIQPAFVSLKYKREKDELFYHYVDPCITWYDGCFSDLSENFEAVNKRITKRRLEKYINYGLSKDSLDYIKIV